MSNVEDLERFQPLLRQGSSGGAEASREEWIDPVEDGARSAAVSWISMTEVIGMNSKYINDMHVSLSLSSCRVFLFP